ncbi:Scr1 family TA system antitoxin-like transcriptional regulator [Nonomuraea sp. NEAU-A123]|uniref:Scr1 family TA system antitoxin-like transcriptional regulator n=1 Tax=Nonomuraea sp. NEAU-A123 TaxID=2839649 RepID=UPI0027E012AD|nr:Scr1 family TA system antitoxin-like transcriptional regulator [Nonomuraea sp. NEAU-A123]
MHALFPCPGEQDVHAKLLTSEGAPNVSMVMNEAVIRRVVGGSEVMHAQLQRLLDVADLRNVTLQVLPFAVGVGSVPRWREQERVRLAIRTLTRPFPCWDSHIKRMPGRLVGGWALLCDSQL